MALTYFCGSFISQGWSDSDILLSLRRWNLRNRPPLLDQKLVDTLASIRKCDERNHPVPHIVEEFNQSYAVATLGGKTVVIWEHDRKVDFMSFNSFREYNSHLPRIEKVPCAQYWLTHSNRRTYSGITFDPSVNAANSKYFNLWKGLAVEPCEGDCSKYLQHIRENITNGDSELYEYVLDWMADAVQNTSVLPGVSLVMCGSQGTGKGIFARYFGQLFGSHFKHVQTAEHLTGKFTQHLADAVVILADEVVWGGDKQREGILKTLITEPTRYLEAKGKDAVTVSNYVRVLMSTNEAWAVPAGLEERRYCVMAVGDKHMQDSDYFAAITSEMDSGGLEAFLQLLLGRDISKRDIRNFPRTDALLSQKERTLPSVPKWWLNCLKMGSHHPYSEEWVTMIYTKDLFANYCEATLGERFAKGKAENPSDFISALKQYVPMIETRCKIGESPSVSDAIEVGSRPRGYKIADLDQCRTHFEGLIGHTIAWEACHG